MIYVNLSKYELAKIDVRYHHNKINRLSGIQGNGYELILSKIYINFQVVTYDCYCKTGIAITNGM